MRWLGPVLILAIFTCRGTVYGDALEPSSFPSLASVLSSMDDLSFCGEAVPVDNQEVRERLEKQVMLALWHRSQAILWLKRSRRYFGHIEKLLKENRMPSDLKYLAVAESDLRPHAVSNKGAVGFWQFIASTGKKYGLVINKNIDERRNFFASTQAAIQYLDMLHRLFGSWTLAVAAYNMGEERLTTEIVEQGSKDYYRLYLPFETQRFIFRLVAIKMIMGSPEKYGFSLAEDDYYPPMVFDEVRLECGKITPLRIIAEAANTYFKVIKDLNPEIRGYQLNAGSYGIRLPKGAAEGFDDRFKRLSDELQAVTYVVEKGDSLSLIARRFDVSLLALAIWNRLDVNLPIQPGDRLIVFSHGVKWDENEMPVEKGIPHGNVSGPEEISNADNGQTELPEKDEAEDNL